MTRRLSTLLVLGAFVFATPAQAQTRRTPPPPHPNNETTFGVRAGVSGDPTQFYFGGHVETPPLTEHLTFRPNAEFGFGDNQTLLALNFEFVYSIPLEKQPWRVYLGAGPSAVFVWQNNETNAGGGLNFLVGVQHRKGLFTELKVGVIKSPSVKFAVGYVFQ